MLPHRYLTWRSPWDHSLQMNPPLPDRLETSRLVLREPCAADATGMFDAYTQDMDVARFMVWRPHGELSQTQAFVAGCIQGWASGLRRPYVIAFRGDESQPIGMIEARILGHTIDIGYVLARRHWGNRLMPEAVTSLAEACLVDPRVFRVQATCDIDNIGSARTLERAGFLREGRLDRFTSHPNVSAEPRPCYMYARCR